MKFAESLQPACVKVPLQAASKPAAIRELVELLARAGILSDAEAVYQAVWQRESRGSTGIGMGLAVPHAKTLAVKDLYMAVGKPAEPIDFASRDSQPVNLIVLLVSPPDQIAPHIQTLARISRLMCTPPIREAIDRATTSDELYRIITQQEV